MVLDSANGALEVINSSEKFQIFGYSTTFGLNTAQDGQTPNAVLDNTRCSSSFGPDNRLS